MGLATVKLNHRINGVDNLLSEPAIKTINSCIDNGNSLYKLANQGSYRLWNSGKTLEFEQNGCTYGKIMEFSLWRKKVHAFFKKIGGGGCVRT